MRTLYRLAAVSAALVIGVLLGAQPASAAAYTVWAPYEAATTTYHTGLNRIVVCDRLADGMGAYGEMSYWDGSTYQRVGSARDRNGADNGDCGEAIAGPNMPARRWVLFESCTMNGDGERVWCSWREIWDDGTS
jgi:hypothetical protein